MSDDLAHRLGDLTRAIEGVLVAGHAQRRWLKDPHPPLDAGLATATAFYGGPCASLDLWVICAALEALRAVWTGQAMREPPDPSLTTAPVEAPP